MNADRRLRVDTRHLRHYDRLSRTNTNNLRESSPNTWHRIALRFSMLARRCFFLRYARCRFSLFHAAASITTLSRAARYVFHVYAGTAHFAAAIFHIISRVALCCRLRHAAFRFSRYIDTTMRLYFTRCHATPYDVFAPALMMFSCRFEIFPLFVTSAERFAAADFFARRYFAAAA